jgi:hypothetical protein
MADEQTKTIPGEDRPLSPNSDGLSTIQAVKEFRDSARHAQKRRMRRNRENREAYLGIQDWSHKKKGQSREFLPKVPTAVEQFTGFVKRALTQFGAWYEPVLAESSQSPLASHEIRQFITCFTDSLYESDIDVGSLAHVITDAIKVGSLESLAILKVHTYTSKKRVFEAAPGETQVDFTTGQLTPGETVLRSRVKNEMELRVDVVRPEDYFKDPTGRGMFEIHETEQDLSFAQRMAEQGTYDKAAVKEIEDDFVRAEDEKRRNVATPQQDETPSFRKRVQITEFWGTLLNPDGSIAHENCWCVIANDRYVLVRPTKNPLWHQTSPFVAFPLIRVPFSVWHKALYDDATQLNFALNELYNLMLDGGIAAVWGIKQVRVDAMSDPRQAQGGFAQGDTIAVNQTLPPGAKVLETVSEGDVPAGAMLMFEATTREFTSAALSSELKMGSLPAKEVRATEIASLEQSQAVTLDAIISDIEINITHLLGKIFLTILQFVDNVSNQRIINAIGIDGAFRLAQMSKADRFAVFANDCSFKVHGLSAVLARVRDFQKMASLLQMVTANPILLQAFFKKYSGDRILNTMMRSLNINPENIERDSEEAARVAQDLAELPAFQNITQPGAGSVGGPGTGGDPGAAEIAAVSNPTAGLAGVQGT